MVLALTQLPQLLLGSRPLSAEETSWFPWHAVDVPLSGFHGLFSWTPVTLIAVLGLAALWRRAARLVVAFWVVFAAYVAVIGSSENWWGGEAFGARRFIGCTPILLGLAVALDRLRARSLRLARVGIAALVAWNLALMVQYSTGLIPRDQPVDMRTIIYNQAFEVPSQILGIARTVPMGAG